MQRCGRRIMSGLQAILYSQGEESQDAISPRVNPSTKNLKKALKLLGILGTSKVYAYTMLL